MGTGHRARQFLRAVASKPRVLLLRRFLSDKTLGLSPDQRNALREANFYRSTSIYGDRLLEFIMFGGSDLSTLCSWRCDGALPRGLLFLSILCEVSVSTQVRMS